MIDVEDRTDSELMPDFRERLAQELRAAALRAAVEPVDRVDPVELVALPRPSRRRRLPLAGAVATVVVAVAGVAALLLSDDRAAVAHGQPPVLQAPEVDPSRFAGGLLAEMAFGPDTKPRTARAVETDAGPAYLIGYDDGWCLSVPDPALPGDGRHQGVGCASTADFERFGVAVTVGTLYVAALPDGVPPPRLREPDGAERELLPTEDYAIVALQAPEGSAIVRYARDGSTRRDPIR